MAFAQFYYDPAVEFERVLDEHAHTQGASKGGVANADKNTFGDASGLHNIPPSRSQSVGTIGERASGQSKDTLNRRFVDTLFKWRDSS
ncbi:hypothetical protein BD309DRAFT_1014926 [Dichomitus squalens]|nr:hypothetical protein BD309DRAFT_1014926 [Dichomitus squalens]